jgi:hypothetical protein
MLSGAAENEALSTYVSDASHSDEVFPSTCTRCFPIQSLQRIDLSSRAHRRVITVHLDACQYVHKAKLHGCNHSRYTPDLRPCPRIRDQRIVIQGKHLFNRYYCVMDIHFLKSPLGRIPYIPLPMCRISYLCWARISRV